MWNRRYLMSDSLGWQAVAFRCGGDVMLIGVTAISEIADAGKCTSIPGCKDWFLGLGSIRGNVLPVSDLSGYIFNQNCEVSEHNRILVIKKDEDVFGLLVDEILGLRKFSVSQLISDKSDIPAAVRPCVVEVVHDGDQFIPVIDPALIVSSNSFLNVKLARETG